MSDNAPGWQADPTGKHDHRYWDGAQWTENVADAGVASIDPYEPEIPEPVVDEAPAFVPVEPTVEPDEPVAHAGLFGSAVPQEPIAAEEPFAAEEPDPPVAAEDPYGLPYAADEPTGAEDTVVDQAPLEGATDTYPTVADAPSGWSYDDAPDGAPAPPPPYVPEDGEGGGRFAGLSKLGDNLGDGARKGLLVGGGVLVAILLAVVAMSVLGGDDDPPTTPIGSSGSTDTTAPTGPTEPPKEGEYGSDPALDALHDACEDGDFAACDQLYLESPAGSGYQTFGDTCGDRNEPSGFCVKVYADDGGGEGGEEGLPDDFEESVAESYATALGLEPAQAECLAGKFREAVEQGTLTEEDAMTGVVDYLSDCDISLEDFSSN